MVPSADMLTNRNEMLPAHTAYTVKAWKEENEINLVPWPAQLSDFNLTKFLGLNGQRISQDSK